MDSFTPGINHVATHARLLLALGSVSLALGLVRLGGGSGSLLTTDAGVDFLM